MGAGGVITFWIKDWGTPEEPAQGTDPRALTITGQPQRAAGGTFPCQAKHEEGERLSKTSATA